MPNIRAITQTRRPAQAREANNPVIIASMGQKRSRFAMIAVDASDDFWTIFEPAFASASLNVAFTASARRTEQRSH
jgi:hypothetical protein